LKHYLSVGAAIAALAFTTATGFAQTAGTVPNSGVPGSGSTTTNTASQKALTKKQKVALNHTGSGSNQPNTAVPGSNGYSGSGKKPGNDGSPSTTLNSLQMNRKSTAHNNPNSVVPGSASYSGSGQKPGNAGAPTATLDSLQMNRKSTAHNNPNSVVPGSDSYSGSAPKP
jgi:hypothetical protein